MDAAYWDRLAHTYDHRVLNAWEADRRGILKRTVRKHANPKNHAADFGCGTGHALPLLSKSFRRVHGYDYSKANLRIAKKRHHRLDNVKLQHCDLSVSKSTSSKADFAVCVNVLIGPDPKLRSSILKTIGRSLRERGRLLLVVPSFESTLYVDRRLMEWNLLEGVDPRDARKESLESQKGFDPEAGIVPLDGVHTKHYRKEELADWLRTAKLRPLEIRKVSYTWNTEFEKPPPWLGAPYPWDWMALAEKPAKDS